MATHALADAMRERPADLAEQRGAVAESDRHGAIERQDELPRRYGRKQVVDRKARRSRPSADGASTHAGALTVAGGGTGEPAMIMSASMGPGGGSRAQAHLKQILLGVLAKVRPAPELTVGGARALFEGGKLVDEGARKRVERQVKQFVETVGA